MICKSCSGEGVKIIDKKSYPSDCTSCVAKSLVRYVGNPLGIMTLESASKLCSCLANNHEGGIHLESSDQFKKTIQEYRLKCEVEKKEKSERVFYQDKEKQEATDYYQKRIIELKKLDESGPEWILKDNEVK